MVNGRSKLKLYYDQACTKELIKNTLGQYLFDDIVMSNNSHMPYTLNIWCKNDGTHTAHDVVASITSTNLLTPTVTCDSEFLSLDIKPIKLVFNIDKEDTSKKFAIIGIVYDNL